MQLKCYESIGKSYSTNNINLYVASARQSPHTREDAARRPTSRSRHFPASTALLPFSALPPLHSPCAADHDRALAPRVIALFLSQPCHCRGMS